MGKEATAWHVLVLNLLASFLQKKEGFDLSPDRNPHSENPCIQNPAPAEVCETQN